MLLDLGKFGFLLIYGRFGLIYGGTWSEQTYSPPKKNQILLIPDRSGPGRDFYHVEKFSSLFLAGKNSVFHLFMGYLVLFMGDLVRSNIFTIEKKSDLANS